ncbi:hypothetical protein Poli38472_012634 [Pythium oligandrum]|uniref:Uncharacterized protein n=1 Tax=Pythium oligandrum TaxID=41045 RepID=A0A8K1CEB4_PYTOL|nr:hypothetical protein Poli38472_012634 [Pythium oligandrum]|eukprot:TMW61443.1 hypothetical protein Poli38472_012634 [Pythium oligandrum]
MTHLQTVEEQGVKKQERLIVELSPVGYHKAPSIDQVGEWLEHMLTGLKHWHSLAYCHGDVSWRNIVFVPTERNGDYWMLIDLDKSHVSNTTVIEWSHRHQGQKLRMEHDLSQLGGLMETLPFTLPANMKSMQEILLTAIDTSGLTANAALTKLGAFLR